MKPILSFTMFEHLIHAVSTQLECCPALYADTSQACISPLNRKTQVGGHFPQSSLPVQCWSLNLSSINPSGIMQPTCWTLLKQVIKDSFEFFFVCFVFKFVMASNFSLVFFYKYHFFVFIMTVFCCSFIGMFLCTVIWLLCALLCVKISV